MISWTLRVFIVMLLNTYCSSHTNVITLMLFTCCSLHTIVLNYPLSGMRVSEILVNMHDGVLNPFKLLRVATNKWVGSVVVLIIACMLSALDDHRYIFDTTFEVR